LIKQNDQKKTPLNFLEHKKPPFKIINKITYVKNNSQGNRYSFPEKFCPIFKAVVLASLDSNRDKIYLDSDIKKIAITLKGFIIH